MGRFQKRATPVLPAALLCATLITAVLLASLCALTTASWNDDAILVFSADASAGFADFSATGALGTQMRRFLLLLAATSASTM